MGGPRSRQAGVATAWLLAAAIAWAAPGNADKKRRAPPEVLPVVVDGMRYEAPLLGQPYGYAQDGGIVVARRADTGALDWTRRIYGVVRDAAMEGDKQDVFIERMTLSPDRRRLLIVNEHGRMFELNLDGSGLRARR